MSTNQTLNTINSFGNSIFLTTKSVEKIVNGSINPSSISVGNLNPNQTLKTDANKVLVSSLISQSDLDFTPLAYTGTIPAPVGNFTKISNVDGNVDESKITETDIINLQTDKLDKLNDTATSLSVETNLDVKGQLNYASNLTNVLVDVGKWDVYANPKGLSTKVTGQYNPYVELKFYPPSNPPSTSDEARTIIVRAGDGFLNKTGVSIEEIKSESISFVETELIVPSNYNGYVRVNNSGVVNLSPNGNLSYVTTTNLYMARIVSNTDSILFIDSKPPVIRNCVNEIFETGPPLGTYFASGSSLPITETVTPLTLNSVSFPYYYNNVEYSGDGQSLLFFYRFHRDATEALGYKQLPAVQYIDNLYDNNSNNVVVVPDGFYKKDLFMYDHYQYEALGQRKYFIVYSTQIYPTLKEAQLAPSPPIPSFIPLSAVVLCNFITSVNNTGATVVLEEIQDARKFLTAEIPYASRDDHSQYLLVDGSRLMTGNLQMGGQSITGVNNMTANNIYAGINTLSISGLLGQNISVNNNINLNNNNIEGCQQINGLTPVGGLYCGISNGVVINQASGPSNLLPVSSVGSLSIPANGFKVGDAYHLVVAGIFPTENGNDDITIDVKQNGTTIASINLELENFSVEPSNFELEMDFVVRSIGVTGVIASSADFSFNRRVSTDFRGTRSTDITTINTTTPSSLSVLATVNGGGSSIQSRLAYLRKQY